MYDREKIEEKERWELERERLKSQGKSTVEHALEAHKRSHKKTITSGLSLAAASIAAFIAAGMVYEDIKNGISGFSFQVLLLFAYPLYYWFKNAHEDFTFWNAGRIKWKERAENERHRL